jgi:hypothetical protein
VGFSYGDITMLMGLYGEVGGQRTVYGEGMGLNIWGIQGKDVFGFVIFQN